MDSFSKDDILLAAARSQLDEPIDKWKRDVAMISEHTTLPDAFESLTNDQHQVAIVHDEFGGMTGIVTMEDIVETLLGLEIVDEVDTRDDMQAFARALWEKRSKRMGLHLISKKEEQSDEDAPSKPKTKKKAPTKEAT